MRPCLCETGRTARRCHEASVIRSMSGNGSVRKKVDLTWSVVSSSGDSALECDHECVEGWFRALCLSNTSRTPPRSGLSDKRKGSTRHLGVRRDRLGWFTSTQPPGAQWRVLSGMDPSPGRPRGAPAMSVAWAVSIRQGRGRVQGERHLRDLSTSNSAPGEDGSKPCSISQRAAHRLRHDHQA